MTERLPVSLITGFLGSGKTTLIARLLTHPAARDTAVIVNELGAVPLDHHLVRQVDEEIVVLPNGCICCSVREDLVTSLRDLGRRRQQGQVPAFGRVVIETTGLADPAPVVATFITNPHVQHLFTLDHVIATVDAVHGLHAPEAVKQAAVADRLVITKTDLADTADLAAQLRELNPTASIVETSFGDIEPRRLFDGPEIDLRAVPAETHSHSYGIDAVCLVYDEPLDWTAFGLWLTMLLAARGADVLRVKGLLDVGGEGPLLVNGVQHVVYPPEHVEAWPDEDHCSRLVFIGRGLLRDELSESLAAFVRGIRRELQRS